MDKMEELRAGIAEMRSVALRLTRWADDLEASCQGRKTSEKEVKDAEPAAVETKKKTVAAKAPVEPVVTEKELTLPEVRAILADKCAAGFSTQVKALIGSYGVSSLKGVPAEKYGELLEAVSLLGGDADAG